MEGREPPRLLARVKELGLGSGYRLMPVLGCWRGEQRSTASPQGGLRSTGPEQIATLKRSIPHLSSHSNPVSSMTPEAAKRTGQAERGRERERGGETTSHLGSHFEPLPLLPPAHHMFGGGQRNPGLGSCRSREERGPCSQGWDGGTPTQLP